MDVIGKGGVRVEYGMDLRRDGEKMNAFLDFISWVVFVYLEGNEKWPGEIGKHGIMNG